MARPVVLDSGMSTEQALEAILCLTLAQVRENEAGVACGTDSESIHQMRVEMRRLASALRVFRPWVTAPASWLEDLDWLGQQLGAARDADVLATTTMPKVAQACQDAAALSPLIRATTLSARYERQRAAAAIGSARYSQLMLGLAAWVQGAGWRDSLDGRARKVLAEPVARRAAKILASCHRCLIMRSTHLLAGTPTQRHRIRKAAKRARYAAEFFQSLHLGAGKHYIGLVQALQDDLGALNDASVAAQVLAVIEAHRPDLAPGVALANASLVAIVDQGAGQLGKRLKQLKQLRHPAG